MLWFKIILPDGEDGLTSCFHWSKIYEHNPVSYMKSVIEVLIDD